MNRLLTIVDSKYQRLEYLESTGTQYIDTGISKETNIVCELTVQSKDTSGNKIILGAETTGGQWFGTAGTVYGLGGSSNFDIDSTTKQKVTINIKYQTSISATINDITKTRTVASTGAFRYPTYRLFGLRGDGNEFFSSCKIFSGIIQDENGNILRKYIPVLRKTDNELGMLDLVEGKFYPNAGTGKFTANLDTMYAIVQGSPTQSPYGVFSGFTSANYLSLDCRTNTINKWEVSIDFSYTNSVTQNYNGLFSQYSPAFQIYIKKGENKLKVEINTTTNLVIIDLIEGSSYNINIKYSAGNWTVILTNKGTGNKETRTSTTSDTWYLSGIFRFGITQSGSYGWDNTINLNTSYLKIGATKYNLQAVVGYTIVGSPTIVDGVVSGFSNANYLRLANITFGDIEFVLKIKTPNSSSSIQQAIFYSNYNSGAESFAFRLNTTNQIFVNLGNSGSITSSNALSLNTDYWVKIKIDNTNKNLKVEYSTNGTTYTQIGILNNISLLGVSFNNCVFGLWNARDRVFNGSIDMNETYIKKDGKLWFNGQQA